MTAVYEWLSQGRGELLRIADRAAQQVAAEVLRDAAMLAPVDTGNLRNSLTVEKAGDGGVMPAVRSVYLVGTDVEYAPAQEFGTSRTRAQPYLGPALARAKGRYGS